MNPQSLQKRLFKRPKYLGYAILINSQSLLVLTSLIQCDEGNKTLNKTLTDLPILSLRNELLLWENFVELIGLGKPFCIFVTDYYFIFLKGFLGIFVKIYGISFHLFVYK